ncbi:MAG: hypothetical protein LBK42_13075 [Propionibacteriaceae bacterium]|jgi:hypothetical protein|nr:hypothetical protein [Propionibacteriaceae bacterium]
MAHRLIRLAVVAVVGLAATALGGCGFDQDFCGDYDNLTAAGESYVGGATDGRFTAADGSVDWQAMADGVAPVVEALERLKDDQLGGDDGAAVATMLQAYSQMRQSFADQDSAVLEQMSQFEGAVEAGQRLAQLYAERCQS